MMRHDLPSLHAITRRQFLGAGSLGLGALALAAYLKNRGITKMASTLTTLIIGLTAGPEVSL